MTTLSLALPMHLYPAFAPLPISFATHLGLLEYQLSRKKAVSRQVSSVQLWTLVEERVRLARALVYEYMNPFVLIEQKRIEQGLPRRFPEEAWLLDALATYAPEEIRYSPATLELWQKKRLLRRDKPRGLFDLTSVAALLITRIAEGEHQRHWLPSEIAEQEPIWWCYGQTGQASTRQPVPLPLSSTFPETILLSTPWLGVGWLSQEWTIFDKVALRWRPGISSIQELERWDPDLADEITGWRSHALLGRPTMQTKLIQEAGSLILERIGRGYQHEKIDINDLPIIEREQ